jgi:hypothetical protein
MTSFASTITTTPLDADSPRQAFDTARRGDTSRTSGHGSTMVAKDRPHPAPRPSPDMAADVDRAAFNEAWEREQRRAAFIAMRTDPQSGGRVRRLNRANTR